jgi:hypothetical protein
MSNIRLVISIAQKYDNLGVELADLIQVLCRSVNMCLDIPAVYLLRCKLNLKCNASIYVAGWSDRSTPWDRKV